MFLYVLQSRDYRLKGTKAVIQDGLNRIANIGKKLIISKWLRYFTRFTLFDV